MVIWTFSRDFAKSLIAYNVKIPRNGVASGTIFQ